MTHLADSSTKIRYKITPFLIRFFVIGDKMNSNKIATPNRGIDNPTKSITLPGSGVLSAGETK